MVSESNLILRVKCFFPLLYIVEMWLGLTCLVNSSIIELGFLCLGAFFMQLWQRQEQSVAGQIWLQPC